MAIAIDRVFVDVRARSNAARARELVVVLPDRLRQTIGPAVAHAALGDGVMLVPRLRVELTVDLAKTSGEELAQAIADACAKAVNELGVPTATSVGPRAASAVVESIDAERPIRCADQETEIVAWLLARLRGRSTVLWKRSLDREFAHVSLAGAFATLVQRVVSPAALIEMLSDDASDDIVRRCTESEAGTIMRRLDDQREPDAQTWRIAEAVVRGHDMHVQSAPYRTALAACVQALRLRAPGASRAALTLVRERAKDVSAAVPRHALERDTSRRVGDRLGHEPAWLASHFTGLWLLLAPLARLLRGIEERDARAQALGVAVLLAGEDVLDDPALRPWQGAEIVEAGEPAACRRLAVAAIRDVARRLTHLERARCSYLLRTVVSGPGMVRETAGGWEATLPRSPLRIVLDRVGLLGPLATPWPAPLMQFVRGGDA